MAFIPSWFSASTKSIAEKALDRGVLKYPGICYIQDTQTLAWVTIENKLKFVKGTNQITNVKFVGSNLMFYSDNTLLFSYDLSMTEEDRDHIVEEVKKSIGLDQYIKTADVSRLLDDIIGNLEDKNTVVDYINSLSYNKLSDRPITNLIGSLTTPVYVSSLDDGIYRIKGQFIIGGNDSTVHSSAEDVLFLISHDIDNPKKVTVTQLQGKQIVLYFIASNGTYTTDKYITESWINDQDFITSGKVKEYVDEIIQTSVFDLVDQRLDEKLDEALDKKISGIDTKDLITIF